MGIFGDLLSLPVKIVNAPVRAVEDLMNTEKCKEDDRILSKPLDFLADQLKNIDKK